jgi:hypothetical protein
MKAAVRLQNNEVKDHRDDATTLDVAKCREWGGALVAIPEQSRPRVAAGEIAI